MWTRLVKLLHYLGLVGIAGGIVVSLLLVDTIDATSPSGAASMRTAIGLIASAVVVPSLVVLLLTGMLLVVARPHLIGARWVWAKAALGLTLGGVVLLALQPAVLAAAAMARDGALGERAIGSLQDVVAREHTAAIAALAIIVISMIVAIWRPRFGRRRTVEPGPPD
jgi:hypothetical protein